MLLAVIMAPASSCWRYKIDSRNLTCTVQLTFDMGFYQSISVYRLVPRRDGSKKYRRLRIGDNYRQAKTWKNTSHGLRFGKDMVGHTIAVRASSCENFVTYLAVYPKRFKKLEVKRWSHAQDYQLFVFKVVRNLELVFIENSYSPKTLLDYKYYSARVTRRSVDFYGKDVASRVTSKMRIDKLLPYPENLPLQEWVRPEPCWVCKDESANCPQDKIEYRVTDDPKK
jgi:hypothetical protein